MYPLGKKQFMFLIQYLVTQEDTYSDKWNLPERVPGIAQNRRAKQDVFGYAGTYMSVLV